MKNNIPQITFIYDRYRKASPTVPAKLEMRITYEYKQKYISTGIMLYPDQWKDGKIYNCKDIVNISKILDKMVTNVRQIIYEMMEEGNIDIFSIQERLRMKTKGPITFLEFCTQRADIRKYGKSKDSQERYDRFIRLFKEWGKIKTFEDINEGSIISYDKFLKRRGMKNYSKWNNYHRFLNSFILDAIDAGYLRRNPYKWVNIEKNISTGGLGKYLSPEEFNQLRNAEMPMESLVRVKDLFIFQTYTCLSYTDLRDFDISNIQEIKGMKVYTGKRQKTKKTFTIPLLSPAWDILCKYDGKLPVISNVKYNEYLKLVALAAGINKPVSSHWARHTGATMLLNEGIGMQIVSKICGHSSTKITEQVYAKLLDETIVDAIKEIKENIE